MLLDLIFSISGYSQAQSGKNGTDDKHFSYFGIDVIIRRTKGERG